MKTKLFLFAALGAALLAPAQAQLDVSITADIRLGKALPPPPPEVVVVDESGPKGPPPWAPAHGFRRNRDYYFYPGANVYYRPTDRTWFYLDGGKWSIGVNLPTSIRVDFGRSVALTMETDTPYEFHEKVQAYYPGDYFTKKVRVKEKGGKPDQAVTPDKGAKPGKSPKPDRADESGRGKGKGK